MSATKEQPKRGRGRPKTGRVKDQLVRLTVFVDESTKANMDSLAHMQTKTASQLVTEGMAALMKQLPKKERELLAEIEQRRVFYQALRSSGVTSKPISTDQLAAESKSAIENRGKPPTYEQHDLEAKPYDPRYLAEHEAEQQREKISNPVQPDDPPVDEPEFSDS
jgi:hypothetical protein